MMERPWSPPWRTGGEGKESLVVVSAAEGLRTTIEIGRDRADRAGWISRWLDSYFTGSSELDPDGADFSLFYAVWTSGPLGGALGVIDDAQVSELGYGAEPAGPAGVPLVTLRALLDEAQRALRTMADE